MRGCEKFHVGDRVFYQGDHKQVFTIETVCWSITGKWVYYILSDGNGKEVPYAMEGTLARVDLNSSVLTGA